MHEKQYFAEHTKHRGYFLNLQTKSKLIKKQINHVALPTCTMEIPKIPSSISPAGDYRSSQWGVTCPCVHWTTGKLKGTSIECTGVQVSVSSTHRGRSATVYIWSKLTFLVNSDTILLLMLTVYIVFGFLAGLVVLGHYLSLFVTGILKKKTKITQN